MRLNQSNSRFNQLKHYNHFCLLLQALRNQVGVREVSSSTDFQHVTHVRLKETYMGYPVWGGDVIVHKSAIANSDATVNGVMYQDLKSDLNNTPVVVFTAAQSQKVLQKAVEAYEKRKKGGKHR